MPKFDQDKAHGLLVGLAVCEALAGSDRIPSTTETLPSGVWGDGTAMALTLAESLAECQGLDPRDQMIRYTSWFRYGHLSATDSCEFIDPDVKQGILRFERTWNPEDSENTQGAVCLARIAPVVLYFSSSLDEAVQAAETSTRTTHCGLQTRDASRLLAAMLWTALTGQNQDSVLRPDLALCAEVADIASGTTQAGNFAACSALDAAITAFRHTASFAEGCALCQAHGNRAMAVYGQLAGAWYGLAGIPCAWRDSLVKPELLHDMTTRLLRI